MHKCTGSLRVETEFSWATLTHRTYRIEEVSSTRGYYSYCKTDITDPDNPVIIEERKPEPMPEEPVRIYDPPENLPHSISWNAFYIIVIGILLLWAVALIIS